MSATPREHDEKTASLFRDLDKAAQRCREADAKLMRLAKLRHRQSSGWTLPDGRLATREIANQILSDMNHDERNLMERCSISEAQEQEVTALRQRDIAREEIAEQEAAYTGWSRFFLVTSSSGHVHSSMHCSTCRPTTTYGWMPELSGQTETQAVTLLGPSLCSVCFPTAPVEHVGGKITAAKAKTLQYEPPKVDWRIFDAATEQDFDVYPSERAAQDDWARAERLNPGSLLELHSRVANGEWEVVA